MCGITGQGSTAGTCSRIHTLLMRVTEYTNSSGSAPFFSSRMDTKLAQGRVPATWERRQSWDDGSCGGEGSVAVKGKTGSDRRCWLQS